MDNIFVERLWRTVKYENIYLNESKAIPELKPRVERCFKFLIISFPWSIFFTRFQDSFAFVPHLNYHSNNDDFLTKGNKFILKKQIKMGLQNNKKNIIGFKAIFSAKICLK